MRSRLRTEALILLLAAAPLGAAAMRDARVDDAPKLKAGEGLAVFAVEAPFDIEALDFAGPEGQLVRVMRTDAGRDLVFVRAPAGRWVLKTVTLHNQVTQRFEVKGGTEASFEVRAGHLSYHSDLRFTRSTPAVRLWVGGVAWDELGSEVRRRGWDPGLLRDLPFELVGPALSDFQTYGGAGVDGPYEAWLKRLPVPLVDQLPLTNAVLEKYRIAKLALGADRETTWKSWDELPAADALRFAAGEDRQWLFLKGMWGVEGQAIGVSLSYHRDRLVEVRLRAIDEWSNWQLPPADVLADVKGWTDAP